MLRKLYDWTLDLAGTRHALFALALIALIESSVFPIPPDILLIPMILAARDRAWLIAFICTLASVIGGIFGYGIGYYLFEQIGQPVLEFYHHTGKFSEFRNGYNQWGAWAVLFAGITPFPYKVITILSGVTGLSMPVFIISSILARGIRFFVVAALLWKYGVPIRSFVERYLGVFFILFIILLFGGFVLVDLLL